MKRILIALVLLASVLRCPAPVVVNSFRFASVWTPETPGTLSKWFDADNISGSDTDPVSTWPNASAVSGDATASGTDRPTLQTAEVNGHAAVSFDGNDWMSIASSPALNTDSTVFIVLKRNSPGSIMTLLCKDAGAASAGAYNLELGTTYKPDIGRPYIEGGVAGTSTFTTSWSVLTAKVSGTTVTHFLNGAANGSDTLATGTATGVAARIGVINVSFFTQYYSGMMANILIYTDALSTANQQAAEDYLGARYGISITH